jgi:hypothetical protein
MDIFAEQEPRAIKVAYWVNNYGEEMASRVHAEFSHGDSHFVVVHDWREGTRGHGFIILERDDMITVRLEMPR